MDSMSVETQAVVCTLHHTQYFKLPTLFINLFYIPVFNTQWFFQATLFEETFVLKLNSTHQHLVYANDVNILDGSMHSIKKKTESLVVASKEIGL
jgi:hypothetical protein